MSENAGQFQGRPAGEWNDPSSGSGSNDKTCSPHPDESAAASQRRVRGAVTAFSDIASVSVARGVSIVLALISTTIVTHLLTPRQYSILAYISVLAGLMFTATASWTSTAVTRYGREELEQRNSIRCTSWSRLLITAPVVLLAAILILALKPTGLLPGELTWAIIVIVLGTGLGLIAGEHVGNLLEAGGRMKLTALSLAGGRILSILSIIVLILAGAAHSAETIAIVWLVVAWLFSAAVATAIWHVGMWPPTIDWALFRRMVRFSLPMIAFAGSQYVIAAVDIVILGDYRSPRDVGLYAIAYNGYGVLQQLATTATIVLSPLFVSLRAASQEQVIKRFYRRMVPQGLLITAVCAGLAAPLLRIVVPIVFGPRFAAAAVPLALLLMAWMFYAAASFVAPILVLHERARAIGMINVIAAVVNVVGDWVLIGVFGVGITGPAIATAGALAVIVFGYFYVSAVCIAEQFRFPLAVMAPGAVGVAAAIELRGLTAVGVGTIGTVIATAIVMIFRRPFSSDDGDLVARLDMPRTCKALVLKALAWLG